MKPAIVAAGLAAVALAALAAWLWTPDLRRPALEAAYLRAPGDLVDMGGWRLHVRDTGPRDAPALVMLHGFGSSLHTFEPWARALEDAYRVVRFDLPGSGLSDPDPTGVYADARSIEVLRDLMDRLGVRAAAMVGNSIGGRLAWRFAAAHPDRVTKLVLISPDGFASPGFDYGRAPEPPAILGVMRFVLPRALARANVAAAYGDPALLTDETLDRYWRLLRAPGVRAAMIERMRQTVLVDPAPLLRAVAAPTLLLWGERDRLIPIANAADYLRLLPRAELVAFPSLGHVPHEEAPDVSLAPVRRFLAD